MGMVGFFTLPFPGILYINAELETTTLFRLLDHIPDLVIDEMVWALKYLGSRRFMLIHSFDPSYIAHVFEISANNTIQYVGRGGRGPANDFLGAELHDDQSDWVRDASGIYMSDFVMGGVVAS